MNPKIFSHIFVVMEDPEKGEEGLVSVAQRRAGNSHDGDVTVMSDALGVTHDLVEHVNGLSQIGTVHDELEALGAIWVTRGVHADLRRDGIGRTQSPENYLSSDVSRMYRYWLDEYFEFEDQPESDHDESFEEVLRLARTDILYYIEDGGDEADTESIDEYLAHCLNGMRLGAAKQEERFPDQFDANNFFWEVVEEITGIFQCDYYSQGIEYVIESDGERVSWYNKTLQDEYEYYDEEE